MMMMVMPEIIRDRDQFLPTSSSWLAWRITTRPNLPKGLLLGSRSKPASSVGTVFACVQLHCKLYTSLYIASWLLVDSSKCKTSSNNNNNNNVNITFALQVDKWWSKQQAFNGKSS